MAKESKVDNTTILEASSPPMPNFAVITGTTAAEGNVITRSEACFTREETGNSHKMPKVMAAKTVSLVMLTPRTSELLNKDEKEELYRVAPI